MTHADKRAQAKALLNSERGSLIIGQALAEATKAMRTHKYPETSNIEDMECLGTLFPFYALYLHHIHGVN